MANQVDRTQRTETIFPPAPPSASKRFQIHKQEIIDLWAERVLGSLTAARKQDKPSLLNSLPAFLENVARAWVLGLSEQDVCGDDICKTHGEDRAYQNYTLREILIEYKILHEVIVEVLEREGTLTPKEYAIIRRAIHQAMIDSAGEYVSEVFDRTQQGLDDLRQEREIRERFVSTLTHDLKGPLTAAKMGAELYLKYPDKFDPKEKFTRLLVSLERAERMIHDLLDANQIKAGQKLPIQVSFCDLQSVVRQALTELSVVHGDRFQFESSGPVQGYWSCDGMRRVIENLCSNAVKYGAEKPIRIRIARHRDRVELSVHNAAGEMGPADIGSLFQTYKRSASAVTSGIKGWGIGLTLVKGIAEAHGGTVAAESSVERGTTLTVTLPLDARPGRGGPVNPVAPA